LKRAAPFPDNTIVSYEVIEEYDPVSGHRPVVATFNLEAANHAPEAEATTS
jgi:hypothetical protein